MKKAATNENVVKNPVTNCRALRKKAKISQTVLAHNAGVSLGVVWRLENAQDHDSISCTWMDSFLRIASALDVRPVNLYPRLGARE